MEGIVCPGCNSIRTKVIDSRDHEFGRKRRRLCQRCGERFTTWEMTEATSHVYEVSEIYKALSKMKAIFDEAFETIGDFGNERENGIHNNRDRRD